MATIKAVIFDWGGVLANDPTPGLMRYCAEVLGVLEEKYIAAHSKFHTDFQAGRVNENVFWKNVCGELNVAPPKIPSLWGDAFRSVYSARTEVFALVSKLHDNGYKTALLSNAEPPAMQYFYQQGYNMFNVLVFSCAEGIVKPERKIYETTVGKLDSQPRQAILIDDKAEFINGAEKAGLNGIIFKNLKQVKGELAQLGVKTD